MPLPKHCFSSYSYYDRPHKCGQNNNKVVVVVVSVSICSSKVKQSKQAPTKNKMRKDFLDKNKKFQNWIATRSFTESGLCCVCVQTWIKRREWSERIDKSLRVQLGVLTRGIEKVVKKCGKKKSQNLPTISNLFNLPPISATDAVCMWCAMCDAARTNKSEIKRQTFFYCVCERASVSWSFALN